MEYRVDVMNYNHVTNWLRPDVVIMQEDFAHAVATLTTITRLGNGDTTLAMVAVDSVVFNT